MHKKDLIPPCKPSELYPGDALVIPGIPPVRFIERRGRQKRWRRYVFMIGDEEVVLRVADVRKMLADVKVRLPAVQPPKRGPGRPRVVKKDEARRFSVLMSAEQYERFVKLGGAEWLRKAISNADLRCTRIRNKYIRRPRIEQTSPS
jgi:hypothetical protein